MGAFKNLSLIVDEFAPNPIKNWWYKYLITKHLDGYIIYKLLPKDVQEILTEWEELYAHPTREV